MTLVNGSAILFLVSTHFNILSFDKFSNEVEASEDMLESLMRPRFLALSNDPSVITINWHWSFYLRNHTQFYDEFLHPNSFLDGFTNSNLL